MKASELQDTFMGLLDPEIHFQKKISWQELNGKEIHLILVGKPSYHHAVTLVRTLITNKFNDNLKSVFCLTKVGMGGEWPFPEVPFELHYGEHPLCGENSFESSEKLVSHLSTLPEKALVLFVISGGTSSLLVDKHSKISKDLFLDIQKSLLKSNLSIERINVIRQIISKIKNGKLLKHFKGHQVINLIFSDIPSGSNHLVGSGPSYFKQISSQDIERAIKDIDDMGHSIEKINDLLRVELPPRVKVLNFTLSNYEMLREGLLSKFENLSLLMEKTPLNLELTEMIDYHFQKIKEELSFFISGGEVLLELPNSPGVGGRNSHFVACFAKRLFLDNELNLSPERLSQLLIFSYATDGNDGSSSTAGAWMSYERCMRSIEAGESLIESIKSFDTSTFMERVDCHFKSTDTGNNLMDLRGFIFI